MLEFFGALAAFVGAHLIPAIPAVRGRLVALLGRGPYLAIYSFVSIALLGWVIVAAQRSETVPLWDPAPWQWWAPLIVMPFAFWLLLAGLLEPNPLSVSLRASPADGEPGAIVAVTRHPVLWGFLLWALAHIPPNGDLVSVILFVGMAALAALGLPLVDRKVQRRVGKKAWTRIAARTSVVPFAALLDGRAKARSIARLTLYAGASLAFYAWFLLYGHAALIGVDPLAGA